MKRFLASALIIGVASIGMVGCDEKTKVEEKKTVETPNGKATEIKTDEIKKSGDAKEGAPASTEPK